MLIGAPKAHHQHKALKVNVHVYNLVFWGEFIHKKMWSFRINPIFYQINQTHLIHTGFSAALKEYLETAFSIFQEQQTQKCFLFISQHNYLHLYPNVAQFGSVLPEIWMDQELLCLLLITPSESSLRSMFLITRVGKILTKQNVITSQQGCQMVDRTCKYLQTFLWQPKPDITNHLRPWLQWYKQDSCIYSKP